MSDRLISELKAKADLAEATLKGARKELSAALKASEDAQIEMLHGLFVEGKLTEEFLYNSKIDGVIAQRIILGKEGYEAYVRQQAKPDGFIELSKHQFALLGKRADASWSLA